MTPRNAGKRTAQMRRAARRHPDRVLLIDWVTYSGSHGGGWVAGDGLDVSYAGGAAYAAFGRRAVRPFAWPPVRALHLPRSAAPGKACGRVSRFGARLSVHVVRG